MLLEQDAQMGHRSVAASGGTGVQCGLARCSQAVHPALRRGPAVFTAAGRAEGIDRRLDDLDGQGVAAGAADGADVVQGYPEGQITSLEPFALPLLHRVGVGAIGQVLAQAAQLARVQARRQPGAAIGWGSVVSVPDGLGGGPGA
jgi:hypothetical protein